MSFPIFSKAAQFYLVMSSSSEPVECMFSAAGLVANGKRATIGPEKLNCVRSYMMITLTLSPTASYVYVGLVV